MMSSGGREGHLARVPGGIEAARYNRSRDKHIVQRDPSHTLHGSLVCECPEPVLDGLGECQACRRKPLALCIASAEKLKARPGWKGRPS